MVKLLPRHVTLDQKPVRVLWSQCAPSLQVPHARSVKYGDRAFSAADHLPIKCAKTRGIFIKKLLYKTYFSTKPLTSGNIVFHVQRLGARFNLSINPVDTATLFLLLCCDFLLRVLNKMPMGLDDLLDILPDKTNIYVAV